MNPRKNERRILQFRVYGGFAHFNQPVSNNFRNTYTIIPKTQLLGLFGAILGLSGYKDTKTEPEFSQELSDISMYIAPNSKSYPRFIVKYNSKNSFLNNRKDTPEPNVIVNEQVLMGPDYEVGVALEEKELHQKLVKMIKSNRSVFFTYLGKNEFPANIEYIGISYAHINREKEPIIRSIFPFAEVDKEKSRKGMRIEQLPIGFDENYKFIYETMAIPDTKGTKVVVKHPENFIEIGDRHYYVF